MPKHAKNADGSLEIKTILDLVNSQEKPIRDLFVKALNLYVSPTASAKSSAEKLDQLRQAIEQANG
jgi:hypothetical protein